MEQHFHMVAWIDHHEAHVFSFNAERYDHTVIRPQEPVKHIHHKANSIGAGHAPEDQHFYENVAKALGNAGAILIMGPANARIELLKHIEKFEPKLVAKINMVERADHMTDGEIVAHARKYFSIEDRMSPQR